MSIIQSTQTRLARAEAIASMQRAELPEVQEAALQAAVEAGDAETAASIARTIRNRLLRESDAQVALDRLGLAPPAGSTFTAWLGFLRSLGDAVKGGWAAYRQELRDVPQQEGFPLAVHWPETPGSGGGGDVQP